ncbi:MAG: C2H2-type zinc finger protein [Haloplanus sp.]
MSDTDHTDDATDRDEAPTDADATPATASDDAANPGDATPVSDPDDRATVSVPPGADPHVCRHCGMPFVREEHLALHRGLRHPDALSSADREAFDAARESEQAGIERFRLVALGVLVFVYFGFLLAYAVFA